MYIIKELSQQYRLLTELLLPQIIFISHMELHRVADGCESVSGRLTARWSQQESSDAQVLPNVAKYIFIAKIASHVISNNFN